MFRNILIPFLVVFLVTPASWADHLARRCLIAPSMTIMLAQTQAEGDTACSAHCMADPSGGVGRLLHGATSGTVDARCCRIGPPRETVVMMTPVRPYDGQQSAALFFLPHVESYVPLLLSSKKRAPDAIAPGASSPPELYRLYAAYLI